MSRDEQTPLLKRREQTPLLKRKEAVWIWWYAELLMSPVLMLFVGIAVLTFTEGWDVLTSTFVITQIVTTTGYGFEAKSDLSKIFVAFFAVSMLVYAAYIVSALADTLLTKQSEAIRRYLKRLEPDGPVTNNGAQAKDDENEDVRKLAMAVASCIAFVLFGTIFFRNMESCTCGVDKPSGCQDSDYATCVATGGYVTNFVDAFFMSVMTLATIGVGDYQPRTVWGRAISIPWMFFGVAIFANSISAVGTFFYKRRKSQILMAADCASSNTQAAFRSIDKDGKGHLDRNEFLAFTLLKYEVISEHLVEAIFKEYDQYEGAKDGRVTRAMIHERQNHLTSVAERPRDTPVV